MKSDVIDIEGQVHHMTAKAVLFSTTGLEDDAVWLPLSRVEISDDTSAIVTLTLPERLAIEKELV